MPLKFAAITPHPPIIVPGVGSKSDQDKCRQTIESMGKLSHSFANEKIETIVIVSPHSPLAPTAFAINTAPILESSLADFGAPDPHQSLRTDQALVNKIISAAKPDLSVAPITSPALDHGVNVPLHFLLSQNNDAKIVSLSYCGLSLNKHFQFGKFLKGIIEAEPQRVAFIASGDLSHRLTPDAPAGFAEQGKIFDEKVVDIVKEGNLDKFIEVETDLAQEAGECGLRSFAILAGTLADLDIETEVFSYEGPFGVGYLVAEIKIKQNE